MLVWQAFLLLELPAFLFKLKYCAFDPEFKPQYCFPHTQKYIVGSFLLSQFSIRMNE
jgi:hypothetical protein